MIFLNLEFYVWQFFFRKILRISQISFNFSISSKSKKNYYFQRKLVQNQCIDQNLAKFSFKTKKSQFFLKKLNESKFSAPKIWSFMSDDFQIKWGYEPSFEIDNSTISTNYTILFSINSWIANSTLVFIKRSMYLNFSFTITTWISFNSKMDFYFKIT